MYIHRKVYINKFYCKTRFLFCFLLYFFTHVFFFFFFYFLTLQDLSLYPKAMHWVFLFRKSPCWAWYQTQQRCSAPYRAVFPCSAPHPSTRLLWPRSRDVCHPLSASTHHSWEGFYAGQSSNSFNMTAAGFKAVFLLLFVKFLNIAKEYSNSQNNLGN